jgi:hypothetical protein
LRVVPVQVGETPDREPGAGPREHTPGRAGA